MIIFALMSIPSLLVLVIKKNKKKDIAMFFWGVVVSGIVSIVTWAIGTLYLVGSDSILNTTLRYILIYIIPLLLLLATIFYFIKQHSCTFLSHFFIYGFFYWNMLFQLLADSPIGYNLNVISLPLVYMVAVLLFNSLFNSCKVKHMQLFFLSVFPISLILIYVLSKLSHILVFAIIVFVTTSLYYFLKFKVEDCEIF